MRIRFLSVEKSVIQRDYNEKSAENQEKLFYNKNLVKQLFVLPIF